MPESPLRILHLSTLSTGDEPARLGLALGTGLDVTTMTVPNRLLPAIKALRRADSTFDVIHAWDVASLTVAAFGSRAPIAFTPPTAISKRQVRWLRTVMRYRRVHVICGSEAQRSFLLRRGVKRCDVITPGVEIPSSPLAKNAELRRALGFAEADRVLLLVGPSTRASGHAEALWAAAILHVLDPKYRVLVKGGGPRTERLGRFAASQKQPALLTVAGEAYHERELYAAADRAVVTPTGLISLRPVALAMAAGIPIVGTATNVTSEMLEDGSTAYLTPPDSPRALARRILDAEAAAAEIGASARLRAGELFGLDRFVGAHRSVYQRVAGGTLAES